MNLHVSGPENVWLSEESCTLEDFKTVLADRSGWSGAPNAITVERDIPIYDARSIKDRIDDPQSIGTLMAEWAQIFLDGPGIVVFKHAIDDAAIMDDATAVLDTIIEKERETNTGGDHFAKTGANSRVWNAHEKMCVAAPEVFARYYANNVIPLIARSWLGPYYQVTAQVNVVRPGGQAQTPHRDYHMGFQSFDQLRQYPAHAHRLSAALTLQGAIAHNDMPIESGPTKLLPYSQRYLPGYFAANLVPFQAYFEEHYAQLPLEKGDMVFFNPAVFHAAGANRTSDVHRFANLLQIGSGYGRSIEVVDRGRMAVALYPVVSAMKREGVLSDRAVDNVIAAGAEGYPFPANLDNDSPTSGMAPPSQQELFATAIAEGWEADRFAKEIDAYEARRVSH
ncbi:phytanoyl-CoA dioxygenase family protein [Bauldia sp.]|uniref:phytanoyl-CoA dioxygenase family protein n=1 Tax=Bauldia sp. TaxID=2575872 RepID=UPI003BAC4E24